MGRGEILKFILSEARLKKDGVVTFQWKYPFQHLFSIGQMAKLGSQ